MIQYLLLLVSFTLIGCVSTESFAPKEVEADAKMFKITPDTSSIYIYRTWRILGNAGKHRIIINGKQIGILSNGTFFHIEVPPGEYDIWITGLKSYGEFRKFVTTHTLGKNEQIFLKFKMAGWWNVELELKSADEAKNDILKLKMLSHSYSDNLVDND